MDLYVGITEVTHRPASVTCGRLCPQVDIQSLQDGFHYRFMWAVQTVYVVVTVKQLLVYSGQCIKYIQDTCLHGHCIKQLRMYVVVHVVTV